MVKLCCYLLVFWCCLLLMRLLFRYVSGNLEILFSFQVVWIFMFMSFGDHEIQERILKVRRIKLNLPCSIVFLVLLFLSPSLLPSWNLHPSIHRYIHLFIHPVQTFNPHQPIVIYPSHQSSHHPSIHASIHWLYVSIHSVNQCFTHLIETNIFHTWH